MKKNNGFSSSILVVLLILGASKMTYGQSLNWSMLNYSRERTSWVSNETVLYPPLTEVSKYTLQSSGSGISGLTFYDNLLYASINGTPNIVEAIDMGIADTLWTFQVPGSGGSMNFACAQNDSLVFAAGQNGLGLYALDRITGQPKWNKPVGSLFTRNIILDDDYAYFYSADSLFCIQIHDGTTIWSKSVKVQGTPAVDDQYVYALGYYKIRIYNKLTGDLLWETTNSVKTTPAIVVDDNCFYTSSNDTVFAYEKDSWNIKWSITRPGATIQTDRQNSFAVSDSVLCFNIRDNGDGNGQLMALDKATGDSLWLHTFQGDWVYAPVIANGVVYVVPSKESSIYGFHLLTGVQLFYDNSYSYRYQPIVADHKLYVIASKTVVVFGNSETDVAEDFMRTPDGFNLLQNYPNPFNPKTNITFMLPEKEFVSLKIYNNLGKEIHTLISENRSPGLNIIEFDGSDLPSGLYFYKMVAGSYQCTRKLLLMK